MPMSSHFCISKIINILALSNDTICFAEGVQFRYDIDHYILSNLIFSILHS